MHPVSEFVPLKEARPSQKVESLDHAPQGLDRVRKRKRSRTGGGEDSSVVKPGQRAGQQEVLARRGVIDEEGRKHPSYVAGHSRHAPRPKWPFPHGDVQTRAQVPSVQDEFDSLNPPPLTSPLPKGNGRTSLHQQHLAAITNVMHTSLLKGDYIRAGRAWGMILRTLHHGRFIDTRANGRWGIGAEILLRREGAFRSQVGTEVDQDDQMSTEHDFSESAFKSAKDYYEQLILQFPYQKHARHAINALTFYPAMFGLCIYEAVELSTCELARVQEAVAHSNDDDHDYQIADMYDQSSQTSEHEKQDEISTVKSSELDSAKKIAARLDELLLSPPYDSYSPIMQLRGMVALWVADLCEDLSSRSDGNANSKEGLEKYTLWRERDRLSESAKEERDRARRLFGKIEKSGASLPQEAYAFLGTTSRRGRA